VTALTLAVAYVAAVVGVARVVRLVTSDTWPPVKRARDRWEVWTATKGADGLPLWDDEGHPVPGPWTPLFTCPFCFAPYPAAAAVAAAVVAGIWTPDLSTLAGWWWTLAVWASGSYAAAMIVLRDEPPPVDE
jgi:hypothetical protein